MARDEKLELGVGGMEPRLQCDNHNSDKEVNLWFVYENTELGDILFCTFVICVWKY